LDVGGDAITLAVMKMLGEVDPSMTFVGDVVDDSVYAFNFRNRPTHL
jgi:hypothetical protein